MRRKRARSVQLFASMTETKERQRANLPSAYTSFEAAESYRDWACRFDVEKPSGMPPRARRPRLPAGCGRPTGTRIE